MNKQLEQFLSRIGRPFLVVPYGSSRDPDVTAFVWLMNVERQELSVVHNQAFELALQIAGDAPLSFLIGVATSEQARALEAARRPKQHPGNGAVVFTLPLRVQRISYRGLDPVATDTGAKVLSGQRGLRRVTPQPSRQPFTARAIP